MKERPWRMFKDGLVHVYSYTTVVAHEHSVMLVALCEVESEYAMAAFGRERDVTCLACLALS